MKKLTKLHIYAALAGAGLALSPIVAHGQTSPGTTGGSATNSDAVSTNASRDLKEDHDYGWIGLAGLLGLLGLMRRDRKEHDTSSSTRRAEFAGTRT